MSDTEVPAEWWTKFETIKPRLQYEQGFAKHFTPGPTGNEEGDRMIVFPAGEIDFPTGKVIAGDPFCSVDLDDPPYAQKIPPGSYPFEIAGVEGPEVSRFAATRVKVKPTAAVYWESAVPEGCDLEEGEWDDQDVCFGFCVDAGLACVMDAKTRDIYCPWRAGFDNVWDEFFEKKMSERKMATPDEGYSGDWLNLEVPGSDGLRFTLNASGWGDGCYGVYMGYDDQGDICEIVTEFIDWNGIMGIEDEPQSQDDVEENEDSTRDTSSEDEEDAEMQP